MTDDWLARVDWSRRWPELGELRAHHDHWTHQHGVAIETGLSVDVEPAASWRALRPHASLLESAGSDDDRQFLLWYAAIDWSHRPLVLDTSDATSRAASWGIELARAFQFIGRRVAAANLGNFACARAFVDLAGRIRLGFFTRDPARVAPEVRDTWACTELGLVYAVGQLLRELVDLDTAGEAHPISSLVACCMLPDPAWRVQTLESLCRAFSELGGVLPAARAHTSNQVERGIGYLLVGDPVNAYEQLRQAQHVDPDHVLVRIWMPELVGRHPDLLRREWEPLGPRPRPERRRPEVRAPIDWPAAADLVRRKEATGDFAGALQILRSTRAPAEEHDRVELTIARCCLETNELGEAVDLARRAIARAPLLVAAHQILANALLRARYPRDALAACDAWLAVAPDDGAAHHARGKALLALGRPAEARASFDRASQLAPGLVAAAMLRTNLDRQARDLRRDVGLEAHRQLEVPAHLPELVPILAQGRILDAIVWLTDRYQDPAARKLLATCHEYAGDLEAALVVYEHLADPQGMARCLIELGRAEEALAILDDEATELRADALDRLGRTEEAAVVRQHIAWER